VHRVLNRSVLNRREDLAPLLQQLQPGTPVAFEAAYGWSWLLDILEELDLEAIASACLKNDKVDAATLAHLLRSNLLAEAWIAPKEVRDLTVTSFLSIDGWKLKSNSSSVFRWGNRANRRRARRRRLRVCAASSETTRSRNSR
jgi:hypothetical protein